MQVKTIRQRLLETVQTQVMPRLDSPGQWQMVYTEPPFHLPPGVTIDFHRGKPLSPQRADSPSSSDLTNAWNDLRLHTSRYPCLGFVIEGSIDWRIGITERMARNAGPELWRSVYATVGIPAGSFFLMPPGVPYPDLNFPYWERATALGQGIKVLWFQLHRFGMQSNLTYTAKGEYFLDSACYTADSHTLAAAQTLIEELELREKASPEIVRTLLLFCLQRFERGMHETVTAELDLVMPPAGAAASESDLVEQACFYIESHFDKKVTLESVAAHVFISPSQLARLFLAEKGVTVAEYLTRFRFEYVCTLLGKTDLRVNHIGKLAGYGNPSYFCQVFTRRMGCSPQQYRDALIHNAKVK